MGCDGGTIPRRDELVRVKKKPEAKDKDSELVFQWRYCAVTQQVLQPPIVMCGLGKLYNKVSLIELLLNRETMPQSALHIKGLKDIKDLNLTPNPAHENVDKNHGESDKTAPYICPVIGLEMSGKFRFVALWSCGCVFSERALKEIDTKNCHKCQKPFTDDDVVVLNGNDDDLVVMKQRMEIRQQKFKKNREKNKKVVKVEEVTTLAESVDTTKPSTSATSKKVESDSKKIKKYIPPLNGAKRPGSIKENTHDVKKIKPSYSVAKDPKVSDVYKSIFTSHESEKQQNRAHWVTYNPFYN
ncbi:replication termination factor 2 [Tribolium castaneum]|uniref:Replication termination factor 2 n=1 Tax=Tribolium castaneum TaxID=7070 RepID=D6W881_TRICA|nr:PREDICTED: protein RTF2 homolog [Tribolium castaneum]EFA10907.1 Protein RTF2 homolog-like Protein [Tribolium castaneum]|eukprot:XP_967198.1 PREDICTED: protein RTF2 homolog [Tribolium castaneum]